MKTFLIFLGLLVHLHHQALAGDMSFRFGFGRRTYSTLEGSDYEFCIIAVKGEAPAEFTIVVYRTVYIAKGAISEPSLITIPDGFDSSICVTQSTDLLENNCLDSGNTINLSILDGYLPYGVAVDRDCGEAEVQILDDDIIQVDFSQDVFYANEGDSEVTVCVILTCVDGPTKRCAAVFLSTEAVTGLIEFQKKILLIPSDSDNNEVVCCEFEIDDSVNIPSGGTVEFQVHLKTEDLNVHGGEDYAIVRVHDIMVTPSTMMTPTPTMMCNPYFENDTPMVMGDDVLVDLDDCVMSATCTMPGVNGNQPVDCSNPVTLMNSGRNTRLLLTVVVTAPVTKTFTRMLRLDNANDQCDIHLINRGISMGPGNNEYTLEFEGTGPNAMNPLTNFRCTVMNPIDTVIVATADCESKEPYTFTPGTNTFYVEVAFATDVVPDPCFRAFDRIFHYPLY